MSENFQVQPPEKLSARQKAAAAWGDSLPDWVAALADDCDAGSQGKAAAKIGLSSAVVSQVLAAKYPGDMGKVEIKVRAALLPETVACPALGLMALGQCLEWQGKAADYQPTSSLRGRMFDACRACPRYTP